MNSRMRLRRRAEWMLLLVSGVRLLLLLAGTAIVMYGLALLVREVLR